MNGHHKEACYLVPAQVAQLISYGCNTPVALSELWVHSKF